MLHINHFFVSFINHFFEGFIFKLQILIIFYRYTSCQVGFSNCQEFGMSVDEIPTGPQRRPSAEKFALPQIKQS